jgi:hypothetical protein
MPVRYEVDESLRCVHTRCMGETTAKEVIDHLLSIAEDAALPRPLNVLLDLTELTSLPEGGQILEVSAAIRRTEPHVRWGACAIAAPADAAFGAARMFTRLAERSFQRARVFRDLESARRWLASLDSA